MTLTLAALAVTAFVAGLARGFSGFGAALIFVPVAAALTAPGFAAPLLLVVDAVMTLPMVHGAWRFADRRECFTMAIGALAGVPAGAWALSVTDPIALRWGITGLAGVMLILILSGWRFRGVPRPSAMIGVGALAGLFSGAAQIGGPPVVAWFIGRDNAPVRLRANITLFFAFGTVISVASYLWRGLLTGDVLTTALVVGPAYGLGVWAGSHAFGLASALFFRRVCLGLIALALVIGLPVWS